MAETAYTRRSGKLHADSAGRARGSAEIRFGNLLRDARTALEAADLEASDRAALLAPLAKLQADDDFWQHQSRGLVVFRDAERTVALRLPVPVEVTAQVG